MCDHQAASFCAAQFVTSILLGYLSDTYGRKVINFLHHSILKLAFVSVICHLHA